MSGFIKGVCRTQATYFPIDSTITLPKTIQGELNTLFNYPQDIRKAIYTTNAIESLNSVIRNVIKKRKQFPSDDSARKVLYLAIQEASSKWTMPIHNWKAALNRFMVEFKDRLSDYV